MSESPTKEAKPLFTEKEERVLKVAWSCLKSPPDVDMEKLQKAAGFNTLKTTSNTWGTIKKKLLSVAPTEDGDGDEVVSPTAKATKSTPKKRTKKDAEADAGNEDDNGEIPRKRRKTPTKKALQADIANGDEGEEVDMPKKKKKSPVKKPKIVKAEADEDAVADVEEGEVVKTEADSED